MAAVAKTYSCFRMTQCRQVCVSACHMRRKPKPERDMSKRNLQGEALKERLRKIEEDIKRQQPYKNAVADVINRFQIEIEEIEREKHDTQGELMKREMSEREQATKNLTIIAKSNKDLRRQRELQQLIEEDEVMRKEEEKIIKRQLEKEELLKRNTKMVLRIIDESKDFVTFEDLEDKITDCLDTEINFNFAITPSGEKIMSTKPPGNLNNWKGPSPSAYKMGGYKPGSSEWNFIFKDQKTGFEQNEKERKPVPSS